MLRKSLQNSLIDVDSREIEGCLKKFVNRVADVYSNASSLDAIAETYNLKKDPLARLKVNCLILSFMEILENCPHGIVMDTLIKCSKELDYS